jgi:phosphatidylinositol glycan class V
MPQLLRALAVRLLSLAACILADMLLPDHIPSGVELFEVQYSSATSRALLQPFTRWDALHFLKIASEGYQLEHQLAFFPLFPALLRTVGWGVGSVWEAVGGGGSGGGGGLTQHEALLVAGLLLNLCAFALSACVLEALLLRLRLPHPTAQLGVLLYVLNPAGVFFGSLYTESLYALLSFSGLLLCLQGRALASAPFLFLASLLRSNGSLNALPVLLLWLGREGAVRRAGQRTAVGTLGTLARALLSCCSALVPGLLVNRFAYVLMCGADTYTDIFTGVDVDGGTSGYMDRYIDGDGDGTHMCWAAPRVHGDADTASFCALRLRGLHLPHKPHIPHMPLPYPYLQGKHWGVGLLSYYRLKQIPNFLLALPVWLFALYTLWVVLAPSKIEAVGAVGTIGVVGTAAAVETKRMKGAKGAAKTAGTADTAETDETASTQLSGTWRSGPDLLHPSAAFALHLLCLLLVGVLWSHVQISTRLLCASSPLLYAGLAHFHATATAAAADTAAAAGTAAGTATATATGLAAGTSTGAATATATAVYAVPVYLFVYNLLGITLHSNYFPWT